MNKLQYQDLFIPQLGEHEIEVLQNLRKLIDEKIVNRIWEKDFKIWGEESKEIADRLDWLDMPQKMKDEIDDIERFVEQIRKEGFENALLLGMGGSSLAPEVFRFTFGVRSGFLNLEIVDSTHPEFLKEKFEKYNPAKTLYIVSTKSGGTIETISFMKYFFNKVGNAIGFENAKSHFVAITDPGSGLEKMTRELGFRKIFLNNPNIGGRFSALSLFGLVPAALVGINLSNLLERAEKIASFAKVSEYDKIEKNTSAILGMIMGSLAEKNINKLTFVLSEPLKYFGAWAEQLIAESTGKIGKGILPIDDEPIQKVSDYTKDRLFVFVMMKNDNSYDSFMDELGQHKIPFVKIFLNDIYDLGAEFFRWEFATAVAGWIMKLQPFDQPNVESAKVLARKMISDYKEKGKLNLLNVHLVEKNIEYLDETTEKSIATALHKFIMSSKKEGSYFVLQAFIKPNRENFIELSKLKSLLIQKYKLPVTLGFGPRFLHSTGQLHKGDLGLGIFIQFMSSIFIDENIPENAGEENSTFTFGTLITAQALGDRQALLNNNRNVVTINFNENVAEGIKLLASFLS
ncbi:MAG: hypothetical protein Fur0015_00450 [Ignavibacteriales bacterium]